LTRLEYIPFLRDIGRHFSVNRMVKAESYRVRLESDEGLNFIEFNYMLLQAYDFLELYRRHGCRLQMGGSDQWGNIVAGIDLVRKLHQETAFGITFPLITTAGGAKMGKTAAGAVWLDAARTSPYDYFQYWINCADADVQRFLALYTFLPMDEIRALDTAEEGAINAAKTILAYETTRIVHGAGEAQGALQAAASLFGGRALAGTVLPSSDIPRQAAGRQEDAVPQSSLPAAQIDGGLPVFKLFQMAGLAASGGAARRLIRQGGAYLNNERLHDEERLVVTGDFNEGALVLRAGKKRYHKVVLEG
jgi:tyrosyl-tRNA synthetase